MLPRSFKAAKCKTSLKLAVSRIKVLKNKKDVQVKQMRKDLAQLLKTGEDQTARIRVEEVIREEKTMSAYDLIVLYCELIVSRLPIIESQKRCPIDLKEAISSIIYASPRCADIPELLDVRKLFSAKYGKDFTGAAIEVRPDSGVNSLIIEKLSARAPDTDTKIKVLTEVAQEHKINWEPTAFEENIEVHQMDLLNGPTSFTSSSALESSSIRSRPSPVQMQEAATKAHERDVNSSSAGFNSSSLPASVETYSQPGTRATGRTHDVGEPTHSNYTEEEASLSRQKWPLQFKDATSAAQAAAESAERASMAARAAAELASRGEFCEYSNIPPEPYTHGSRYEARNLTASKSQESQHRDTMDRSHKTDEASSASKRIRNVVGGVTEHDQAARDDRRVSDSYTNPRRDSSSEDDAEEVPQRINKTSKDGSLGGETAERHTIRPVYSPFVNHSDDEDVSVSDVRNSDSSTPRSVNADSVHQNFKNEDHPDSSDARQEGIERKLRKASSSRSSSIDPETVWDSPMRKKSFDQNILFSSAQEINQSGYNNDHPALFDPSDSDNEEHLDIDHIFQRHESDFHGTSLGVDSSTRHKQRSGFNEDGSRSLHYLSTQPVESSGRLHGETSLSPRDAVAYKETGSDSEDETCEVRDSGDKASNALYRNQNMGSSLKSPVRENRSDKFLLSPTAAYSEPHSSNESGEGLKLGRLTGGLKNKGYSRPFFLSSPVVNEFLPSETSTSDSSEKPTASPLDKMAAFSSVQKLSPKTNESRPRPLKAYVSDSSDSDDLEQHPASERSGRGSVGSLLSTSRSDDHHLADEKKKFSSTFMRQGCDELDQEISYQRPVGRSPRKSSHTLPATSIDKYSVKETLSPPGKQDLRGAPASILSDQKPEDTRAGPSNVEKTSGRTDIYDKKSPIKTSKGSKPIAISYFDEDENEDEVVFPPRRALGSVGIRSGRVSQRTRSPRVDQVSSSRRDSGTPDSETTALPPTISVKSETTPSPRQHQETTVSVQKDSSGSSKSSLPLKGSSPTVSKQTGLQGKIDTQKPSELEKGSISREGSIGGAPHVHPRLPDYETLAAHFHSLRSNRR
ncbi:unnamed protein product [Spirodela intermedia]|uniref:Uncharacterized protein n=1 Tax=Spirodela intermedia TaxID=51605 RepID=A0A7I8KYK1_SPIIN|nr:unnamed protein product [Spirodela intermedia]